MRTCVVGAGLAGAMVAWQLARTAPGGEVDLVLGARCRADATTASGGAVRAFEPHPEQRRLAVASLVELRASATLQRWARYRPVESVYLRPPGEPPTTALAEIEAALPGAVRLASGRELAGEGWAQLPPDAVVVREHRAGYLAPGRLRDAVLADAARGGVRLLPAAVDRLAVTGTGTIACEVAGRRRGYDVAVLATGGWTAAVLARAGLPADGYRTKSIQYTVYRAEGWRPPQFVDETTGLYGRPDGTDGLLLGLPTEQWGVDPDRPPVTPALHEAAAQLARARFPGLRLGPAIRTVGAADCYAAYPTLSLRPVPDTGGRLLTFTGGAGGSVKTVLAASREAAARLADPPGRAPDPPGAPRTPDPDPAASLPLAPTEGSP